MFMGPKKKSKKVISTSSSWYPPCKSKSWSTMRLTSTFSVLVTVALFLVQASAMPMQRANGAVEWFNDAAPGPSSHNVHDWGHKRSEPGLAEEGGEYPASFTADTSDRDLKRDDPNGAHEPYNDGFKVSRA
ncbi:hypothetical protein E1B28_005169 [Marasmius oreades]|uniref:Uncharacterized protein n=1 Tax=Marasmius oreades TaxID=181124 RepID=A0A9P7V022_9AGAR|nr:uncharacterized protein E1B28_005169 [Marasmius oreades]KAG7097855.1 hypothetical protein E1B28_005169 [Marasmius oreades]